MNAKSFAAPAADKPLEYYEFQRREPTASDVELEVHYCGVCHSDIHVFQAMRSLELSLVLEKM
jgi:uncharacterized zinc-type alcohol dehydrogenase-like protein